MATKTKARVVNVGADRLDEAALVIARAFEHYPMIEWMFGPLGEGRLEAIRGIFHLSGRFRLAVGWPILAAEEDGRLLAAAWVMNPGEPPEVPWFEQAWKAYAAGVGPEVEARMERYGEMKTRYQPRQTHHYLTAIGTLPEAQGRGCGGLLMRAVHELAASDPASTGVGLDTQSASNVSLYEHFGYAITAEDRLDDVPMWFMLRPNA